MVYKAGGEMKLLFQSLYYVLFQIQREQSMILFFQKKQQPPLSTLFCCCCFCFSVIVFRAAMVVSLENLFEIQTEALELLYSKLPVTRLPVKV